MERPYFYSHCSLPCDRTMDCCTWLTTRHPLRTCGVARQRHSRFYRAISKLPLLSDSPTYFTVIYFIQILSNILLSRLHPYEDEITGNHHYVFQHNRSSTDQILAFIRLWRKNGSTMRQYISYSQALRMPMIQYYTVRRDKIYNKSH
jgi:hypothetical protein